MAVEKGLRIQIKGIVQGVGFRPFVYKLAVQQSLKGWVRNTSAGVDIEIEGEEAQLKEFLKNLKSNPPAMASIDEIKISKRQPNGFTEFVIKPSEQIPDSFQPISPDIAICQDCLSELFNPFDRRYRYPFINCTNCGPRFTIIKAMPYDRPNTTMESFQMCKMCAEEYRNPDNRRFHAQPIACPECGPKVWLETDEHDIPDGLDEVQKAQYLLSIGKIVAIKGIGGFHLACDASNEIAVVKLRQRKLRIEKPFALMVPNIEVAKYHCKMDEYSMNLIESPQHPIVILERKKNSTLPLALAPGQNTLGIMLPYTPLHHLLFSIPPEGLPFSPPLVLVMTSGNLSDEPIAVTNKEAKEKLSGLADAFLMHNRDIWIRCDDSVVRTNPTRSKIYFIRRSRGYAPFPVHVPWNLPPILATGAELKNTFCLANGYYAFISHHIGDLDNYETLLSFEEGIEHYIKIFKIEPEFIACDKHPDYLSTHSAHKLAETNGLPLIEVQHHHAHVAACMAEHKIPKNKHVIGVAFDGTGYGNDNKIWGGEFLLSNYKGFQRLYHLKYMPLPGGDTAIRKPAKIALAYLWQSEIEWYKDLPLIKEFHERDLQLLKMQLEQKINVTYTSSIGRLFDAISALIGIRGNISYEAQAAIELEAICDNQEMSHYPIELESSNGNIEESPVQINFSTMITLIIEDYFKKVPLSVISAKFHNSIANMVKDVCVAIRNNTGINTVVLSGGVWQNVKLLKKTVALLRNEKFIYLTHGKIPPNDGGISLGQAIIAGHSLLDL